MLRILWEIFLVCSTRILCKLEQAMNKMKQNIAFRACLRLGSEEPCSINPQIQALDAKLEHFCEQILPDLQSRSLSSAKSVLRMAFVEGSSKGTCTNCMYPHSNNVPQRLLETSFLILGEKTAHPKQLAPKFLEPQMSLGKCLCDRRSALKP